MEWYVHTYAHSCMYEYTPDFTHFNPLPLFLARGMFMWRQRLGMERVSPSSLATEQDETLLPCYFWGPLIRGHSCCRRLGWAGRLSGEAGNKRGYFPFLVFYIFYPLSMTSELSDIYSIGFARIAFHSRTVLRDLVFLSESNNAAKQHLICYQTRKLFIISPIGSVSCIRYWCEKARNEIKRVNGDSSRMQKCKS